MQRKKEEEEERKHDRHTDTHTHTKIDDNDVNHVNCERVGIMWIVDRHTTWIIMATRQLCFAVGSREFTNFLIKIRAFSFCHQNYYYERKK